MHDGSAILTHQGAEYGLKSEPEGQNSNLALLLPSEEDSRYKSAKIGVSKTLHLRQLVNIPSLSHDIGAQDAGTQIGGVINLKKPHEKPIPTHPKGLKMRYKPIGVPDSDDSSSESRPRKAPKAPKFRRPSLATPSQSPKKRRRSDTGSNSDGEPSPKRQIVGKVIATPIAIPSISPAKQTLQVTPASGAKSSKPAVGQFSSIPSSVKSQRSEGPPSIQESPIRPKPSKPTADAPLRSTIVVGSSSSPIQKPEQKKPKHREKFDAKPDRASSQDIIPNGKMEDFASSQTLVSAETQPESQSSNPNPKRVRKKRKTIAIEDETALDDRPTSSPPIPKAPDKHTASPPKNNASEVRPANQGLSPANASPTKPLPNGATGSSQPSATTNGTPATKKSKPENETKEERRIRREAEKAIKHPGETKEERKKRRDEKKARKAVRVNGD